MPVLRGVPHCVKSSLRYRPLTVNATFLGKNGHPLRKVALRDAVSIQTAVTVSAPPMLVCVETLQISKTACAGETRPSASREWRKSSGALRHGLQSILEELSNLIFVLRQNCVLKQISRSDDAVSSCGTIEFLALSDLGVSIFPRKTVLIFATSSPLTARGRFLKTVSKIARTSTDNPWRGIINYKPAGNASQGCWDASQTYETGISVQN